MLRPRPLRALPKCTPQWLKFNRVEPLQSRGRHDLLPLFGQTGCCVQGRTYGAIRQWVAASALALIVATAAQAADAPAPATSPAPTATPAPRPVPPRIPTADLAARPFLTSPVLSPDGLHMAARFAIKGEERLGIADMTGKKPVQLIGLAKHNDLVRYFWAGNGTLILVTGGTVPWYDDEGYATRMTAFDVATDKFHDIRDHISGLKGDDVLWIDPDGKTLVMAFQDTVEDYPKLWKMDIATNKATRISYGYDGIWDWYADSSGVVRYGFGYIDDHNWKMVYRHGPTDHFQVVAKGNDDTDDDAAIDGVIRLTQDSDKGYTLARTTENPFWAIYEYDFANTNAANRSIPPPAATSITRIRPKTARR